MFCNSVQNDGTDNHMYQMFHSRNSGPFTLRRGNSKHEFSLGEHISDTMQEKFETQRSPVIEENHVIIVTPSFRKVLFLKCSFIHTKTQRRCFQFLPV